MPSLCRRGGFFRALQVLLSATVLGGAGMGALYGGPVFVPNGSFEAPLHRLRMSRLMSSCRLMRGRRLQSILVGRDGVWAVDQLIGIFANTPPVTPPAWKTATGARRCICLPILGVGVFQDYDSIGSSTNAPSHAFDARFEVGQSYRLTAGVTISYYQPPTNGATLELSLYYRDAASNQVDCTPPASPTLRGCLTP